MTKTKNWIWFKWLYFVPQHHPLDWLFFLWIKTKTKQNKRYMFNETFSTGKKKYLLIDIFVCSFLFHIVLHIRFLLWPNIIIIIESSYLAGIIFHLYFFKWWTNKNTKSKHKPIAKRKNEILFFSADSRNFLVVG